MNTKFILRRFGSDPSAFLRVMSAQAGPVSTEKRRNAMTFPTRKAAINFAAEHDLNQFVSEER